jgi:hypothetical protein
VQSSASLQNDRIHTVESGKIRDFGRKQQDKVNPESIPSPSMDSVPFWQGPDRVGSCRITVLRIMWRKWPPNQYTLGLILFSSAVGELAEPMLFPRGVLRSAAITTTVLLDPPFVSLRLAAEHSR